LRDSIGYEDMNAVATTISGATAVLSFVFIGGSPKFFSRAKQELIVSRIDLDY